jgi:UDP-N-acetylmuramoyl-L-alanyl-D-glutamate--2,6-diaminopimelate ligase
MWQGIKNVYHLGQSILGKVLYRVDTDGLTFIGITGTDGKTTTSNLLYHILTHAGYKTALISTISAIIGEKTIDTGFHVTTPSPFALQSYIKKAKQSGAKYIILEVTSHALDQNRVFGIPFEIGILTNITNEHLDYHKSYANYVRTKVKLLLHAKTAIINIDDGSYKPVSERLKSKNYSGKIITYGLLKDADIMPKSMPFQTKLIGEFNKYNILAAGAAAEELGIEREVIQKAVLAFTPPVGRTEIVHEDAFTVMIDFAHTPNSIEQILKTIHGEMKPKGRIIHIFGSAGERDKEKRVAMGKVSAMFADSILLTSEDPRSESVEDINAQILTGIQETVKKDKREVSVQSIPDRYEAIKKAIQTAGTGDIVILTGKGHEKSMNLGNGEIPWSEHEAVREALAWRMSNL